MVHLGRWRGRPVTISLKPGNLTVSVAADGGAQVVSYDLEGRLWAAVLDGVTYRRGLDGKIIAKWRPLGGERQRHWLWPPESFRVEEQARALVVGLYEALRRGEATLEHPLPPEGHEAFQRVAAFDAARSAADAARYHQVYKPIGILPPDQYMAVVLQMTEGCSFNTCTFCTFYRDRPFRIKTPEDFRAHIQAVKDFLGRGLSLRRTIFLGDANALVVPMRRLLPLLDEVHAAFDVEAMGGLYAFLDGFSGEKKSAADYAELAARGLKRVYIGMETGNADLLRFLQKPGTPDDVVQTVQALKAGGVAVGVIVLLGAGGHRYAEAHVRDTIAALNAMPLDAEDIIYFSELVVSEGMDYARRAYEEGLQPLTREECQAQQAAIEAGLVFDPERGTPHMSRYDIREFVY